MILERLRKGSRDISIMNDGTGINQGETVDDYEYFKARFP